VLVPGSVRGISEGPVGPRRQHPGESFPSDRKSSSQNVEAAAVGIDAGGRGCPSGKLAYGNKWSSWRSVSAESANTDRDQVRKVGPQGVAVATPY